MVQDFVHPQYHQSFGRAKLGHPEPLETAIASRDRLSTGKRTSCNPRLPLSASNQVCMHSFLSNTLIFRFSGFPLKMPSLFTGNSQPALEQNQQNGSNGAPDRLGLLGRPTHLIRLQAVEAHGVEEMQRPPCREVLRSWGWWGGGIPENNVKRQLTASFEKGCEQGAHEACSEPFTPRFTSKKPVDFWIGGLEGSSG